MVLTSAQIDTTIRILHDFYREHGGELGQNYRIRLFNAFRRIGDGSIVLPESRDFNSITLADPFESEQHPFLVKKDGIEFALTAELNERVFAATRGVLGVPSPTAIPALSVPDSNTSSECPECRT